MSGSMKSKLNPSYKHGASAGGKVTTEYISWSEMVKRCTCVTAKRYKDYGGRGITIYPPWRASFAEFLKYMGPKPGPEYSLDRFPDNNGNYEPGNVRWATRTEQARNKRDNKVIEFNGESLTLAGWAEKTGIDARLIWCRLYKLNWSVERTLTTMHHYKKIMVAEMVSG